MASTALTGGRDLVPTGNSLEMSRRKMFFGAALALGTSAAATLPLPADGFEISDHHAAATWDLNLKRLGEAQRLEQKFDREVYDVARAELRRVAPRPDLQFRVQCLNGTWANFWFDPRNTEEWDNYIVGSVREAGLKVKREWVAHCAARDRLGLKAIEEESERLQDVTFDAEHTLMTMPAPNRGALLWKLERLFGAESGRADDEESDGWRASWVTTFMLDARRFLAN